MYLVVAAASKVIAVITTFPYKVIRSRLMQVRTAGGIGDGAVCGIHGPLVGICCLLIACLLLRCLCILDV